MIKLINLSDIDIKVLIEYIEDTSDELSHLMPKNEYRNIIRIKEKLKSLLKEINKD